MLADMRVQTVNFEVWSNESASKYINIFKGGF